MLALAGALCVIAACGGLGGLVARHYRRRPGDLRAVGNLLAQLETEVAYAAPLPEALASVSRRASGGARLLAERAAAELRAGRGLTAGEAWQAAVAAADPQTAWTAEDRAALLELAAVLGASGRDDQLRHIGLCCRRLEALAADAADEARRQARLWTYLGLLAGAGLVVALL